MKPDISEFSYGYAITDELVHDVSGVTAAPVFPSLYEEGQDGGGYDVMIPYVGIPLFVQFKLSDCMVRASAAECQDGYLPCPFYRMHLRPTRHSRQHQLLLTLEQSGQLVYYAAPAFHTTEELDAAFVSRTVVERSVWIQPSAIGALPDADDHCVSFVLNGDAYFRSVPRPLKKPINAREFVNNLADEVRRRSASQSGEIDDAIRVFSKVIDRQQGLLGRIAALPDKLVKRHAVEQLAYYARRLIDAQLYLVRAVSS